jgi:para-nitrobenzyl esterase
MLEWSGWLVRLCAALALAGFSTCARANEPSAVVTVDAGSVQGVRTEGVEYFKGIPFAAPPVRQLRWEPPQPVAPWQGVRQTNDFAHDCMQKPMPRDAAPLRTTPNEDCLYLNVWRPAGGGTKLPVMIWIYGGGFTNGGTSPVTYDGSAFARDGVVLVSMNYRLGRFGFFGHPALTAAHPDGLLGNYGYLDQIAALKWVKKNIAAFGGDPDNVTVFGESAGGGAVHMLLISPLTAGLFNKAIIESGGGRTKLAGPVRQLSQDLPGVPSADTIGVSFAKAHEIEGTGAEALAALRALPADDVVDGLSMNPTSNESSPTFSGPVQDGRIVAGLPDDVYKSGQFARVPLIIGANSFDLGFNPAKSIDEALAPFGADADKARAAYDPSGSKDLYAIAWNVMADRLMVEPARFTAQEFFKHGVPVYEYRFSYISQAAAADYARGPWAGLQDTNPVFWKMMVSNAAHATEIPYVFDAISALYGKRGGRNDALMSAIAHAYWVNFAKTGNPNGPSAVGMLPNWPAYSADADMLMNFTAMGPQTMKDPWQARLDLMAAHAN